MQNSAPRGDQARPQRQLSAQQQRRGVQFTSAPPSPSSPRSPARGANRSSSATSETSTTGPSPRSATPKSADAGGSDALVNPGDADTGPGGGGGGGGGGARGPAVRRRPGAGRGGGGARRMTLDLERPDAPRSRPQELASVLADVKSRRSDRLISVQELNTHFLHCRNLLEARELADRVCTPAVLTAVMDPVVAAHDYSYLSLRLLENFAVSDAVCDRMAEMDLGSVVFGLARAGYDELTFNALSLALVLSRNRQCCISMANPEHARILLQVLGGENAELWRLSVALLRRLNDWRGSRAFVVREQNVFHSRLNAIVANPKTQDSLRDDIRAMWSELSTWVRVDAYVDNKVVIRRAAPSISRGVSSPRGAKSRAPPGSPSASSSPAAAKSASSSSSSAPASSSSAAAAAAGATTSAQDEPSQPPARVAARRHRSGTVVLATPPSKEEDFRRKVAMHRKIAESAGAS